MSLSQTTVRVRYAETDQMGVVYHAQYLVWFEVGRVELMRQLGFNYKAMELEDDCHIAVVDATCRYRAPARYDDQIVVETRLTAVRNSLLKFRYCLFLQGPRPGEVSTLLADGETTHVTVSREMKRMPLPEKYAGPLREYLGRQPFD